MKESINGDCYIYFDDNGEIYGKKRRWVFCDNVKGITNTRDFFPLNDFIIDAIHIFKNEKQAQKFIDVDCKYFEDKNKLVIAEYPQTVSGFFESKESAKKSLKEEKATDSLFTDVGFSMIKKFKLKKEYDVERPSWTVFNFRHKNKDAQFAITFDERGHGDFLYGDVLAFGDEKDDIFKYKTDEVKVDSYNIEKECSNIIADCLAFIDSNKKITIFESKESTRKSIKESSNVAEKISSKIDKSYWIDKLIDDLDRHYESMEKAWLKNLDKLSDEEILDIVDDCMGKSKTLVGKSETLKNKMIDDLSKAYDDYIDDIDRQIRIGKSEDEIKDMIETTLENDIKMYLKLAYNNKASSNYFMVKFAEDNLI